MSTTQWCVEIRMFFRKPKVKCRDKILLLTIRPLFSCSSGFRFVFVILILLTYGDIESNSGPRKRDSRYNFLVCHWNLKSMAAHNFEKINLLEAYNIINWIRMTQILRVTTYIESTTPIMSKDPVHVRILGNRYLLDALVIHIYKNFFYWKFLLITKRAMLFH